MRREKKSKHASRYTVNSNMPQQNLSEIFKSIFHLFIFVLHFFLYSGNQIHKYLLSSPTYYLWYYSQFSFVGDMWFSILTNLMVTGRFGPITVRTRVVSVLFHFGQVVLARVVSVRFHGWIVSAQFWRVVSAHFILYTVKLQWLEHLWDHENTFETGVVRVNEC